MMQHGVVHNFLNMVMTDNVYQKKKLSSLKLSDSEYEDFEELLEYFINIRHIPLEECVKSYLVLNDMVYDETMFFLANGHYRLSKANEAKELVYDNSETMKYYMTGLSLSEYIWTNHLTLIRFFEKNYQNYNGKKYLEIGPGYGQYLIRALQNLTFEEYHACDISQTSADGCNAYLRYRGLGDKCEVENINFFDYPDNETFDFIVMGEVLEHVEKPLDMLRKIFRLLSAKGKAFISTVINAPMPDHIYLFRDVDSVLDMAKRGGIA